MFKNSVSTKLLGGVFFVIVGATCAQAQATDPMDCVSVTNTWTTEKEHDLATNKRTQRANYTVANRCDVCIEFTPWHYQDGEKVVLLSNNFLAPETGANIAARTSITLSHFQDPAPAFNSLEIETAREISCQ